MRRIVNIMIRRHRPASIQIRHNIVYCNTVLVCRQSRSGKYIPYPVSVRILQILLLYKISNLICADRQRLPQHDIRILGISAAPSGNIRTSGKHQIIQIAHVQFTFFCIYHNCTAESRIVRRRYRPIIFLIIVTIVTAGKLHLAAFPIERQIIRNIAVSIQNQS